MRRLADLSLPLVALASVGVILFSLRPGRSASGHGPVIPGLQLEAGEQHSLLTPVPCDLGASPSTAVDELLAPVAGRYSAYLFDLESGACHVLTAGVSFPPPREERAQTLAQRAPLGPRVVMRAAAQGEVIALRTGPPASPLIEAGLAPDHRYLVVVRLADVPDLDAARPAVDALTGLVLAPEG